MSRSEIAVCDRMIPSGTPGIALWLRNKRLASAPPGDPVLLIHGATFASESLFDVALEGRSFMDMLALAGLDVWAVDIRFYGGSTRPPEMTKPPAEAPPLSPAMVAVDDVASAAAFIRAERGRDRIAILGMSWGGSVAGLFAATHGSTVDRLVLMAPLWLSQGKRRIDPGGELGAYRIVDVRRYETGWREPVPAAERDRVLPPAWFEAWATVTERSDPSPPRPGTIRVPSGAVQDVRHHWTANRPLYDPGAITAPVLILRAEWDIDVTAAMVEDLFNRLGRARHRRRLDIGAGTHMLLLERNRWQATRAIASFLTEPDLD